MLNNFYRKRLCIKNLLLAHGCQMGSKSKKIEVPTRYETTGIRPEFLRDAMPLKQVQRKIQDFLCNGEPIWTIRSRGGKARILVGHGLDHDLRSLDMEYPEIMIR